jgi:hypothetical protein
MGLHPKKVIAHCLLYSHLSSWNFYCSSLLIVYEAERYVPVQISAGTQYQPKKGEPHFLEDSNETLAQRLDSSQFLTVRNDEKIEVKMIDHAHTLPNHAQAVDESYIYSLQSLISHLEAIYSDIRSQKLISLDSNLAASLRKGRREN